MTEEEVQVFIFILLLAICGLLLESVITVVKAWDFISHFLGV